MKNHEKYLRVEELIRQGHITKDACKMMGVDPRALHSWRWKTKKQGKAQVIVHTKPAAQAGLPPVKMKREKRQTQGYLVFGTPEFLKQFVEQ